MKIKTIEYENFRNFKEHGEISCSTDGKITVKYEKNGDVYMIQVKHPLLSVYGPVITLPNGDVLTNAVQKNKICNVIL